MTVSQDLPKLFIVPKGNDTSGARILSLTNPQSGKPTKYYVNPSTGVHEIRRLAAPKKDPRSCLIAKSRKSSTGNEETKSKQCGSSKPSLSDGYILQQPDVFVATPIDPVFLMLRILSEDTNATNRGGQQMFISSEDHFDRAIEASPEFADILKHNNLRLQLESRMKAVCDTVQAGDETCYRLSEEKLAAVLLQKAERMVASGLPPSLEQQFVTKTLQRPILAVEEELAAPAEIVAAESLVLPALFTSDSSLSTVSGQSIFSAGDSQDTTATTPDASQELEMTIDYRRLLRLRTAMNYLKFVYLPPKLSHMLPPQSLNLKPLDEHLAELETLRRDTAAMREEVDFSRKRLYEEDESGERAAAKRLKEDEEKRKKANESRAMKELKKVNVKGMKKMSDFFGKAASKAK